MNSDIQNQLNMCDACSAVLANPTRKLLWEAQKPIAFTAKVSLFQQGLAKTKDIGRQQETPITGEVAMKSRVEKALGKSAAEMAGYLFVYFTDMGEMDEIPKVDFSVSDLQRLRSQQLIQRAQAIYELALPLTKGKTPLGAAHGIDAERVAHLGKGLADYGELAGKPRQARAARKTQTSQVAIATAALIQMLKALDKLIVQFRGTPAGDELVESWFNARRVDDRGRNSGSAKGTGTNIGEGI